jgi:hypothetical protein
MIIDGKAGGRLEELEDMFGGRRRTENYCVVGVLKNGAAKVRSNGVNKGVARGW